MSAYVREEVGRQQRGDQEIPEDVARLRAAVGGLARAMQPLTMMIMMERENGDRDRGYNQYGGRTQFPRRFPYGGYGV
jgi:hypothetical protein